MAITFLPGKKNFLTATWKTAGSDRILLITRLWDTQGAKPPEIFAWTMPQVSCVAFSPDGDRLLLGNTSGQMELFDWKNNKVIQQFPGNRSQIHFLVFSPDGKRALSGSGTLQHFEPVDCMVRLWEIATGKELYCFQGHSAPVWSVAFSPEGERAVSASQDKTVRVWGLP